MTLSRLSLVQLGLGLLMPVFVFALPISEDLVEQVAESDSWRKQLYLGQIEEEGSFRARILSERFYFSGTTWINPQAELEQTMGAIFSNLDQVDDHHAACRFPGRFLYLNRALNLGYPEDILDRCRTFQEWAGLDQYDTLSLVLVEGYYGNPASSFGHLVLRHGRADGARRLLDTSINFGARVPQNESTPLYIVRGLTGGYVASFTDEAYYRQDLVYTQVEQRDMWNYALDLSDSQRQFVLAHLWELLDSPSTYYFLKNNCAFAVAEILEIVFEKELVNQSTWFYPPVTLFHELEEIDGQANSSVIQSKSFVPSMQSVLRALFDTLTPLQQQAFSRYVNQNSAETDELLSTFSESESAELIEALTQYYSYLISGYPEIGTDLYDRRRALILARLQLPAGRYLEAPTIEPTTEPGKTARVSIVSAGYSVTEHESGFYLGWTPFRHSALDLGNDDFSELTLLSIKGTWLDDELATDVGLIRVSQRSPVNDRLPGSWPVSWSIDIGWQSDDLSRYRSGAQVEVDVGQTLRAGPVWGSGFVGLSQSGSETGLGVSTELGVAQLSGLSVVARVNHTRWLSGNSTEVEIDSRLSVSPRWSVDLGLGQITREQEATDRAAVLGLNWHYR